MESLQDKLKTVIPLDRNFVASEVADKVYPEMYRQDTEGRKFNRCSAVVARTLRRMRGIEELSPRVFYAHKEFFQK